MKTKLAVEDVEEEPEVQIGGEAEEEAAPDILFTSLVGAKGLSAEHVFITGLNNGHFPRNAGAITDEEVCRFIVALSRTRKRCHLIQHGVFFARGLKPWEAGLKPSEFLSRVGSHVEEVEVNKDYDFSAWAIRPRLKSCAGSIPLPPLRRP
jgi:superfamily I DNA/RNA helicase